MLQLNDELQLLKLSEDQFANGIAKLIKFVMKNREDEKGEQMPGSSSTTPAPSGSTDSIFSVTQE